MKCHELKIKPEYYEKVTRGIKRFELRKDDRAYEVGDHVMFKEWDGDYTGRHTRWKTIHYILRNCPEYGLMDGYCILGF